LKKKLLLILLLILIPFSFASADDKDLLGHILWNGTTLQTSPSGAKWIPNQSCKQTYLKNEGLDYLGNLNKAGQTCGVCTASGSTITQANKRVYETPAIPSKYDVARAFGYADQAENIYIDSNSAQVYECSNDSHYNVMNVYLIKNPPKYNLNVQACSCCGGSGRVSIDNEHPTRSYDSIEAIPGPTLHYIHYQPNSGSVVTRITDSNAPQLQNAHSDLSIAYPADMGNSDRTITVHFAKAPQLKVQICTSCCDGSGRVSIDNENPTKTFENIVATPGANYYIHFQPDGSVVTRITDSNAPQLQNAHNNLSVAYLVNMGTSDRTITVHFKKIIVKADAEIYDSAGGIITGNKLTYDQLITVKDLSTYTKPTSNPYISTTEKYGSNPNRIWRMWNPEYPDGWQPITRTIIEANHAQAISAGITIPAGNNLQYDGSGNLVNESFYYYSTSAQTEHAFQILYSATYDTIIDFSSVIHDEASVFTSDDYRTADFKIFYTPANSNTPQDKTDEKSIGWVENSPTLTVKLVPNDLSTLDINDIKWLDSNPKVNIEKNSDGTATATIDSVTPMTTFYMQYGGNTSSPTSHYTGYKVPPPPNYYDFEIKYNDTPVTDINWSNSDSSLTVKLVPKNLETLDKNKIKWLESTPNVPITPNGDGTANAIIDSRVKTTFYMEYDGHTPDHWTHYSDSVSYLDFIIKYDNNDVTDITNWESDTTPQTVKLIPNSFDFSSYYWEYKTPSTVYQAFPDNQANIMQPEFKIDYNTEYTFRLTVNNGLTKTHYTQMIPPQNPLGISLGITLTTPAEFNIHGISEDYVKIDNIKINLTPYIPNTITLDDTWKWKVWLVGKNNKPSEPSALLLDDTYSIAKYSTNFSGSIYDYKDSQNIDAWLSTYTLPHSDRTVNVSYWYSQKEEKLILFTAYACLVQTDASGNILNESACAFSNSSTLLIDTATTPPSPTDYQEYITSINNLGPELVSDNPVFDAGTSIPFTADISETNSITVSANKDILAQSKYSNFGDNDKFKTGLKLKSEGDYDNGKEYNELTITSHHINSTHSATQKLRIKPNWFIGRPTGGGGGGGGGGSDPDPSPNDPNGTDPGNSDQSALRIISTRDLRWQSLFKDGALNWGLSTANANTKPLLPNDITISGTKVSPIKTGYAVEFTFDVTKTFYEKANHNVQINVSFKRTNALNSARNTSTLTPTRLKYQNTYGSSFKDLSDTDSKYFTSFNLNNDENDEDKKKFNVTKTKRADGGATYKFIYYLPGTLKIDGDPAVAGDQLNVYFDITANASPAYFNYNDLAGKLYCSKSDGNYDKWNGWVFSYDLTKSNLQDLGNNAN